MTILQKLKERFSRDSVTLDLHDIQALILRSRPEPYVGIHAMLHFDEAEGARALLGRLAPHIASADNWNEDLDFWIGAALASRD
jgi:deferrochelatase/peroxidase EfeB